MGMAIFGWLVLLSITGFVWLQSFGMIRLSLAFTGRLGGEVWLFLSIAVILSGLSWWVFPFTDISIQANLK